VSNFSRKRLFLNPSRRLKVTSAEVLSLWDRLHVYTFEEKEWFQFTQLTFSGYLFWIITTLQLIKRYVLCRMNVCSIHIIWSYYICHIVIIMWPNRVICVASFPFLTNPLPWLHGTVKDPSYACFRISLEVVVVLHTLLWVL